MKWCTRLQRHIGWEVRWRFRLRTCKNDETLIIYADGIGRVCMAVSMMAPVEEIVCIFVLASPLGGRTMGRSKSRKLVGVGNSLIVIVLHALWRLGASTLILAHVWCYFVPVYFYARREMDLLKVNWYGAACFQRYACGKWGFCTFFLPLHKFLELNFLISFEHTLHILQLVSL